RFAAHVARLDAIDAKQRADEAAKARFDEEPITLPPEIAEKQAGSPPAKIGDDTHQPGGELHTVAAKEPDPDLEIEDDQSNLPNELQENVPPAPSTYPDPELPHPPVVSQPISVSLNQE